MTPRSYPSLARMTLRDLVADRWRALSIIFALAAGVAVAAGSAMAVRTLLATRDAIFAECQAADLLVYLLPQEIDQLPDLTRLPGVATVGHQLVLPGTVDLARGGTLSAQVIFRQSDDPGVAQLPLLEGEALAPEDTTGVLIEQALHRVHGVMVGDTLELHVGRAHYRCPVRGVVLSAEHIAVTTNPTSFIPQRGSLAVLFGNLARIADRLGFTMVNHLAVRFDPGADRELVRQRVEDALSRTAVEEIVPRELQFSYHFLEIDIEALGIYAPAMTITLGGLTLLIAILGFRRMIWSRRREIGTLRALGYGRRDIFTAFIAVGIAIGLSGAFLGAAGTILLRDAFAGIYGQAIGMPRIDAHFFPRPYLLASGAAILISIAGLLWPLARLLRVPPRVLLHPRTAGREDHARIPGLLVQWMEPLQITTRWALRNLVRRPGLTLTTVLAVGFAVGTATAYRISLRSMRETARATLANERWDLQVEFHYALYPEELDILRNLPDLTATETYLSRPAEITTRNGRSEAVALFGVVPGSDFRATEIQAGRNLDTGDRRDVVLSPDTARRLAAAPGDTLELHIAAGERVAVRVVGVTRDIVLRRVLAPLAHVQAWSGLHEQANGAFLRSEAGDRMRNRSPQGKAPPSRHGDAGERLPGTDELLAQLAGIEHVASSHAKADLVRDITAMLDEEIAIVNITMMISLAVALVFFLASLNLAVSERAGEYATLRSLGCAPGTLAGMIRIEGFAQAILAALLALPVGVLVSWFLNGRLAMAWFPITMSFGLQEVLPPLAAILVLSPVAVLPALRTIQHAELARALRRRVME
ncbi:MAG: ABC transporter permease [Candidatus Eisenbacteria sp.]|nr:ABC transporter permease [Candidatus Eisenbacteria bacterium]